MVCVCTGLGFAGTLFFAFTQLETFNILARVAFRNFVINSKQSTSLMLSEACKEPEFGEKVPGLCSVQKLEFMGPHDF